MLDALRRSRLLQVLRLALALVAAVTLIGLVVLWPDGSRDIDPAAGSGQQLERATVEAVTRIDCRAPGRFECTRVFVRLRSGPDEANVKSFTVGATTADVRLASATGSVSIA